MTEKYQETSQNILEIKSQNLDLINKLDETQMQTSQMQNMTESLDRKIEHQVIKLSEEAAKQAVEQVAKEVAIEAARIEDEDDIKWQLKSELEELRAEEAKATAAELAKL